MTLSSRMYTPSVIPTLPEEDAFTGQPWIQFTRDHLEIPIFAVSLYLAIIFWVPERLAKRKAWGLRIPFALWSLSLSVYSIIGTFRVVPHLVKSLWTQGFKYSVCTDPHEWYLDGPAGLWVGLFIYSKIPELIDTVFLVLQKKNVIFLHWFHHVTVLLYCWHSYHHMVAPGIWFVAMNYTVHSVMYAYYFFTGVGLKDAARTLGPFITSMQLLQMIIGATVTGAAAYFYNTDTCYTEPSNYKLGLAMYVAYAILFGILFNDLYCSGKRRRRAPAKGESDKDTVCGVELKQGSKPEAGGLFHPQSPTGVPGKKLA